MKSRIISNLFFGIMMALFAITLLVVLPPGAGHAQGTTELKAPTVLDSGEVVAEFPTTEQVGPAADPVDELIAKMLNKYTLYSAGIINALGYLIGLLPFAFFKDDRKRDLLTKTLVAVGVAAVYMLTLGPGNVWPVLSGFALAVFNYNNILKPTIGSTKTPAVARA